MPGGDVAPVIPNFIRVQPDGVLLSVKLQPRASSSEIVLSVQDNRELRIRVSASPVDAAANEALIRLLAGQFGCPRSRVELVRGHKSRHKLVKLHGLTTEEVLKRLSSMPP